MDRHICVKICHNIRVPLKYNHFISCKINNINYIYFYNHSKNCENIYQCLEEASSLSPSLFIPPLCVRLHLLKNIR